jgi:hypothetical protein
VPLDLAILFTANIGTVDYVCEHIFKKQTTDLEQMNFCGVLRDSKLIICKECWNSQLKENFDPETGYHIVEPPTSPQPIEETPLWKDAQGKVGRARGLAVSNHTNSTYSIANSSKPDGGGMKPGSKGGAGRRMVRLLEKARIYAQYFRRRTERKRGSFDGED